jgi:hypothetical protein
VFTYAAVLPKISALLAFVNSPTTPAKIQVNKTIIPTLILILLFATTRRQLIAPMRRILERMILMTVEAKVMH